jgi:hypothetical protein
MRKLFVVVMVVMAMTALGVGMASAQVNGGINPLGQVAP